MKQCLNLLLLTCTTAVLLGGDYASCREYATYEDYTAYEEFRLVSSHTKQLASAPTIVLGKIVAIKHAGLDRLMSRVGPRFINSRGTQVDVYQVTVSIDKVIKGAIQGREIVVEALLLPPEGRSYDLQVLAADKRFVFFLTRRKGSKEWKGISPFAFALRVEEVPILGDVEKLSATEVLRLIAKANISKSDELCAADWITFLGQIYNQKEDYEFSLELMDDPRLRVRGEALALLCEHHPKTPGLYGKTIKLVDDIERKPVYGMIRARVIDHLLNPLDHLKPELRNHAIRTLLQKDDYWIAEATLDAIGDKQYSDLEPDVVNLMMKSKDRKVQYCCIKTLYRLKKKRHYPAMHIFLKDPESYINEFK